MDGGFVLAPPSQSLAWRSSGHAMGRRRRAGGASARVCPHRTAALRCCEKKDPPEDATKIFGGALDSSLEDVLMKKWDQIEHFGRLGTVLEEDDGTEDSENDETEDTEDESAEGAEEREEDTIAGIAEGSEDRSGLSDLHLGEHEGAGKDTGHHVVADATDRPDQRLIVDAEHLRAIEGEGDELPPDFDAKGVKRSARKLKAARRGSRTNKPEQDTPDALEAPKSRAELNAAEEWDTTPRWYFLQVKPGCERSCEISIRNMASALPHFHLEDVLVPTTQIMRLTKGGKSVKKEERMFPGYMLVCMVMDKASYGALTSVPNVQWFMGDPNRDKKKDQPFRPPVPVSDEEMRSVHEKLRKADAGKPEVKTELRPGDLVAVTAGPYKDCEGTIVTIKPDTDEVKASLVVFNRPTTAELSFSQVRLVTAAAELNPKKKRGRKSKAEREMEDGHDLADLGSEHDAAEANAMKGDITVDEKYDDDGFQDALVDDDDDAT